MRAELLEVCYRRAKLYIFPHPTLSSTVKFRITQYCDSTWVGLGMQAAKTSTYPVICRFPLFVALQQLKLCGWKFTEMQVTRWLFMTPYSTKFDFGLGSTQTPLGSLCCSHRWPIRLGTGYNRPILHPSTMWPCCHSCKKFLLPVILKKFQFMYGSDIADITPKLRKVGY